MKAKNVVVGLRVQMKSEGSLVPVGSVGTVMQESCEAVCVHWDTNVGGWGDAFSIPEGHGWVVPVSVVRKFKGESK